MKIKDHIVVVGAGLCGALVSIRLAQKGFKVSLIEKRSDLRKNNGESGRSINLALSDRGINALKMIGLESEILDLAVKMKGRMIHTNEEERLSSYSGKKDKYINSILRNDLNIALLKQAEKLPNIDVKFNSECLNIDFINSNIEVRNTITNKISILNPEIIIGADGVGSVVRKNLASVSNYFPFNYSQEFLSHGYKELYIPPSESGDYQLEPNALHIWPRHEFMLIALPNLDRSFTVTLFLPHLSNKKTSGFDQLDNDENIKYFFKNNFNDVYPLIKDLVEVFKKNPTGLLGTIRCSPWRNNGKALLIGDAAHAIVPFYGQGMNASFEDVVILDQMIDKYDTWVEVFDNYDKERKKNTDAIADMALENFHEMRSDVINKTFKIKKKIELLLEQNFPDRYSSKYSMVTFDHTLSYLEAKTKGEYQDKVLMELCSNPNIENIPLIEILEKVEQQNKKLVSSR